MNFLSIILLFLIISISQNNAAITPKGLIGIQNALKKHNELRAIHHAPPLNLNEDLNKVAQAYADYLADKRVFRHSKDAMSGNIGENLYLKCHETTAPSFETLPVDATQSWYNEISLYDWNKPRFISAAGHFTALVWRSTTDVGFGIAYGERPIGSIVLKCLYVVANYKRPGNVNTEAEFRANVLEP